MAIADAGGIMPPKSTWFEPKLRDGLLVHLIDRVNACSDRRQIRAKRHRRPEGARLRGQLRAGPARIRRSPTRSRRPQPGVLVVRSTKVGEPAMMAPSLKLIVRAGAGVNTIDVKAATARGIQVANCPGKNAIAVAELTLALLLALDRRIPDNVADLRAGKWNKKEYSKARGLYGATIGLLGAGAIAREVIDARRRVRHARSCCGAVDSTVQDRALTAGEASEPRASRTWRAQVTIRLAPSPAEVAARSRRAEHSPRARARDEATGQRRRARAPASPAATSSTPRAEKSSIHAALRRRDPREEAPRRARRVRAGAGGAGRRLRRSDREGGRRYRHAPHRRVHRSGAGSDRGRDRAHRARHSWNTGRAPNAVQPAESMRQS